MALSSLFYHVIISLDFNTDFDTGNVTSSSIINKLQISARERIKTVRVVPLF